MLRKILSHRRKSKDWDRLMADIEQAKKDPQFRKELKQFIKVTTS